MKTTLVIAILISLLAPLVSDPMPDKEKEDMLDALKSQALVLSIVSRQRDSMERIVWEDVKNKATVFGKAILVELEGANLKINCSFTPYKKGNQLSLLIQTSVWMNTSGSSLQYYSHVQTIELKLGEGFQFYPLGRSVNSTAPLLMEMQVTVQSFENFKSGGN